MHNFAPISLPTPEERSPLAENVKNLSSCIEADIDSEARGRASHIFREMCAPYLITDLASPQFLEIHRAASIYQSPLPDNQGVSLAAFTDFLQIEGPVLQEYYLNFKARGFTGSALVAEDATRRLNRILPGSARTESISAHSYTVVKVEQLTYWLDFTIDQFIDYPGILSGMPGPNRKPVSDYAGTLAMPGRL